MTLFFYKPEGAWAADFIPFHKNGRYHLFYLLDWRDRDRRGEGTPWYQISTTDFVHFTEHGEMLPRGGHDAQDLYVFTGSVIEALGQYHIFYTGHNPHLRRQGQPEQGVMHAVSDDLLRWRKLPEDTFFAPAGYEPHDWRDPFVFWNDDAGEFWMLLAARGTQGPARRRGLTAVCASTDLKHWQPREPLYAPGLYFTHECPDLFRMGDWWYLLFSEFTERCVTRYRMARALSGPWHTPADDVFDGRAFYAAKTASDGQRRFLFGWNPTRQGETDTGAWQWGGNLVTHEIVQNEDGTLSVRPPAPVSAAFSRRTPVWEAGTTLQAEGTFACAVAGALPATCKIEATVRPGTGVKGCGLMLRVSDDLDSAYYIRLEPHRQRLVLDSWPRAGDLPHWVEIERPLRLMADQPARLTVFVDGSVCEVYAEGAAGSRVAMSARLYNLKSGNWGVFAQEGSATFDALALSTLP